MSVEWSEFAQRFARELAALPRDTILIVREREEIRHYVQAMWEPDRLYAEAVSNNFLDGPLALTPADEEVLTEAGWRQPAPQMSANWWTELAPTTAPADFAHLADMMVTALRDVQGVRRPADLVHESFRRLGTGLIELVDFGIEVADPQRVTERLSAVSAISAAAEQQAAAVPAPAPVADPGGSSEAGSSGAASSQAGSSEGGGAGPVAATLEDRLAEARQRGDHVTYFELLLQAELVLPATGQAVEDPASAEFVTTTMDGATLVVVFTSARAMEEAYSGRAGLYRRSTFREIAAAWPDPAWSMTINPGLASGSILDAATVARLEEMRRTAERAAAVDAVVTPPPPGVPIRLPHGARLWRAVPIGSSVDQVAEYDAMNARWIATVPAGGPSGATSTTGESHG